jgi:hypothetical protein
MKSAYSSSAEAIAVDRHHRRFEYVERRRRGGVGRPAVRIDVHVFEAEGIDGDRLGDDVRHIRIDDDAVLVNRQRDVERHTRAPQLALR